MKSRLMIRAILSLAVYSITQTQAQIVSINFEGLTGMPNGSGAVPASARLSNQLAGTYGVVFSSEGAPYVAVVALGEGHAASGTNGIGGVTDATLSYSTPIRITFVLPSDPSAPAFTDFVSISGDLVPTSGAPVTLQAFDLDGTLLATTTQIDDHPLVLSVTNSRIHSILITELDYVAFDDLRFTLPFLDEPIRVGIDLACVQVSWNSRSNRQYQVQYSSLATSNTWVNLGTLIQGNGPTNTIIDNVLGQPRRFYRVLELH